MDAFCRTGYQKQLIGGRSRLGGRQTLFRQTLFQQSAVRATQYIFSTLGICGNSRNWEEIGMGRGIGCIESTALIEALRWLRGAEPGECIPVGLGCPLLRKSYSVLPTQLYCSWFSGFGSASFQSVLPVSLVNCSQPADVQTVHGLSE